MRTVLVTGSDTGIGKTHVVAALARLLAAGGGRVQIVKVVETGAPRRGRRRPRAGWRARDAAVTLAPFPPRWRPRRPAAAEGREVSFADLIEPRSRAAAVRLAHLRRRGRDRHPDGRRGRATGPILPPRSWSMRW